MTKPLSLIYLATRPGGVDLLATSLLRQVNAPPYELIVVDGFPGRVERTLAERNLRQSGLPVSAYVKPKPKTFPWSRTGFANAINTGALHAAGDYALFLHDFTLFPEDMVRRWTEVMAASDGLTHVHGKSLEFEAPPPDVVDDYVTWTYQPVEMRCRGEWVPSHWDLGYWASPLRFFEDCNGIDERADFCFKWTTAAFVAHCLALGYSLKVDPSLTCQMVDHHLWDAAPEGPLGAVNTTWRTPGDFADVPEMPVFTDWGANPYNFKDEHWRVLQELARPVRVHPKHHFVPDKEPA